MKGGELCKKDNIGEKKCEKNGENRLKIKKRVISVDELRKLLVSLFYWKE